MNVLVKRDLKKNKNIIKYIALFFVIIALYAFKIYKEQVPCFLLRLFRNAK